MDIRVYIDAGIYASSFKAMSTIVVMESLVSGGCYKKFTLHNGDKTPLTDADRFVAGYDVSKEHGYVMTLTVRDWYDLMNVLRIDMMFKGTDQPCAQIFDTSVKDCYPKSMLGYIEQNYIQKDLFEVFMNNTGKMIFKLQLAGDNFFQRLSDGRKKNTYQVKRIQPKQDVATIELYTQMESAGHGAGHGSRDQRAILSIVSYVEPQERALLVGLVFFLNTKLGVVGMSVDDVYKAKLPAELEPPCPSGAEAFPRPTTPPPPETRENSSA